MDGSFVPVFSLTTTTLAVLLAVLLALAMRMTTRRRLACPADGRRADVDFQQRKRLPWTQHVTVDVVRCSLLPEGVKCAKRCLECADLPRS
jgi:ABC-type taurine transport system ATPase subunit